MGGEGANVHHSDDGDAALYVTPRKAQTNTVDALSACGQTDRQAQRNDCR